MTQDVTVTDLFCGAGGWTEGAEQAGALVRWGVNHWARACETYELNHPNAKVDCNDISATNPGRYPRTDILIASPECTTHSPAGGSRPRRSLFTDENDPDLIAELARIERSRVTMLDVIRFAEHHRYDAIIVENVVEVRRWELFDWWLTGLMNLGYEHETVCLNSMVAWPTPQSRDRIYMVFWRKGNRKPDLRFDVLCWCPKCERQVEGVQSWKRPERPWGKYRTQYVYRCPSCNTAAWPFAYPAATAIDWTLPAPRIGDRAKPLAEKTMDRIRAGLLKYGPELIVAAAGNTWEKPGSGYARAWGIDEPIPTQATTAQHALIVDTAHPGGGHAKPTFEPAPAQTARQSQGIVVQIANSKSHGSNARSSSEPYQAFTTVPTHALVVPLRTHGKAAPAGRSVMPTIVAGNPNHALLVPAGGTWNDDARPTDEPVRTVTGKGHQSLVTMPFLVDYYGQSSTTPVSEPVGTMATRVHQGLVDPAIDIDDCGFRMLEPHEIKAAMAFPTEYVITGNKREQVKQCGNAVTPPIARMLLPRVIASLQGREV